MKDALNNIHKYDYIPHNVRFEYKIPSTETARLYNSPHHYDEILFNNLAIQLTHHFDGKQVRLPFIGKNTYEDIDTFSYMENGKYRKEHDGTIYLYGGLRMYDVFNVYLHLSEQTVVLRSLRDMYIKGSTYIYVKTIEFCV